MRCIECGAETGADWKTRCITCWKRLKGIATSQPTANNAQTGTFPQYAVWEHCDPRIRGDNYSEVSDKVVFIGSERECIALYERQQRARRYSGNGVVSYNYPIQIKQGETLSIGQKNIIHAGRNRISRGEQWEINHGY